MRTSKRLILIAALTLGASPLIAIDLQGVIRGKVNCGKRCEKIMVYLEHVQGAFTGEGEVRELDQRDKVFLPHVLPIVKGAGVRLRNSDPFLHNVHAYAGKRGLFNLAMPAKSDPIERRFDQTGTHEIVCDVHPEMSAYIVVLDNPFFSTVKPDGTFEITGVPIGSYTVVLYHPQRDKRIKQEVDLSDGSAKVEFLAKK